MIYTTKFQVDDMVAYRDMNGNWEYFESQKEKNSGLDVIINETTLS